MDIDDFALKSNSVVDSSERKKKFVNDVNQLQESALWESEVLEQNFETVPVYKGHSTNTAEQTTPKFPAIKNTTLHFPICEPGYSSLNPDARLFES